MKEIWQWAIKGKSQIAEWRKEQFIWWREQNYWVRGYAFALSVLVGVIVIVTLVFIGYGLFCIDTDIARNLILLTGGIVGWYFLARRTNIAEREANISEQKINERIDIARKQIIGEDLTARSIGIGDLEEIALSHKKERKKIMKILSNCIRKLTDREDIKELHRQKRRRISDVEIAFKVLANIAKKFGKEKSDFIELSGVDLSGLRLTQMDLSYFPLADTILNRAVFSKINFTCANFDLSSIDNVTFKECKGLTKKQFTTAFWDEGNCPRVLPKKWNLPSVNPF